MGVSSVRRTITSPTWRISFWNGALNLVILVSTQFSGLEVKVICEIWERIWEATRSRFPIVKLPVWETGNKSKIWNRSK